MNTEYNMGLYFATLEIIGGIATPMAILLLLRMASDAIGWRREVAEARKNAAMKLPPYQRLVVNKCPNPSMFRVQFFKGDNIVMELGADKGRL